MKKGNIELLLILTIFEDTKKLSIARILNSPPMSHVAFTNTTQAQTSLEDRGH